MSKKYIDSLNDTAECYGYSIHDFGDKETKTRFRVKDRSGKEVYRVPALMLIEGWLDGVTHNL